LSYCKKNGSHLTLEYFGIQRSSWWTDYKVTCPVAAKQAQIISPPPPCLTVGMRCLCWYAVFVFFPKHAAVHCDQTSPLWSHLSKGHCSRSVAVCSDVTLQTLAVLPCSFLERRGFLLLSGMLLLPHLIPMEAARVCLVFHKLLLHFGFISIQ